MKRISFALLLIGMVLLCLPQVSYAAQPVSTEIQAGVPPGDLISVITPAIDMQVNYNIQPLILYHFVAPAVTKDISIKADATTTTYNCADSQTSFTYSDATCLRLLRTTVSSANITTDQNPIPNIILTSQLLEPYSNLMFVKYRNQSFGRSLA